MPKQFTPAQKIENKLDALTGRQRDLQKKLHASLRLADFEPRAFSHGSCKVGGRGNVRHAPRDAKITITLGNGEVLTYPLLDVPYDLWPPTMRQEFDSIPRHMRPSLKA